MKPAEPLLGQWQQSLYSKAKQLVQSLENGRLNEAGVLVQQLAVEREQGLYQQVGKLTRELHNAIVNFQLDEPAAEDGSESKVEGASKRLSYAVELTEQAANRTMDLVEQSAPIAADLAQRSAALSLDWQRLLSSEMKPKEFPALAARISDFFVTCQSSGQQLGENLSEILLAQGFQDLTGQLIKRVTALVVGIERDLLQLMLTAAGVEHLVGAEGETAFRLAQQVSHKQDALEDGEGPALTEQAQTQDEVDELLQSLGF